MPLSKIRQRGGASQADKPLTPEPDMQLYEVFTRKTHGVPHVHAGALQAPDRETAVQLAREHYGQDEACVNIWVVQRDAIVETTDLTSPINKAIAHSYRYARDYQGVRLLWKRFQDERALKEYENEDLKEAF